MKTAMDLLDQLEAEIRELSIKVGKNYPNIESDEVLSMERLYVIEGSYDGLKEANDECHQLITFLVNKTGITKKELLAQWKEEKEKQNE